MLEFPIPHFDCGSSRNCSNRQSCVAGNPPKSAVFQVQALPTSKLRPLASMDDPPPKPVKYLSRVLEELGLVSMYKSPLDTKLLCLQRFVRLFAYGASTLILVAYLAALGHGESRIGLFMALTLGGDTIISFFLTLIADGLGRKAILALGALLMAASGVVFGLSGNYWVLLAAAIFGVISPR